mmetsp:Transcript_131611/g.227985  ORF Transcript_131611/g.227985 Transcript_131611/m.227985 type:complete len:147 (-) Transcript_131611:797-1237(-)
MHQAAAGGHPPAPTLVGRGVCLRLRVQIHGPDGESFFWATDLYTMRIGDQSPIPLDLRLLQATEPVDPLRTPCDTRGHTPVILPPVSKRPSLTGSPETAPHTSGSPSSTQASDRVENKGSLTGDPAPWESNRRHSLRASLRSARLR